MVLRGLRARPFGWVAAGAVLTAVLLTGCTGSPPPSGGGTTTASAGTGTPDGLVGGGATATGAAPTFPTTAEAYAKATVTAWTAHDTARLDQLKVAELKLFTSIDTAGTYDTHYAFVRCDGAAGSSYCTFFNNAGDALTLQLQNPLIGQAHAVISGTFDPTTFPVDNKAYAQLALNAWIDHNDIRLGLLTTPDALTVINALPAGLRNSSWTFKESQGAMGSLYYTWKHSSGAEFSFRFSNLSPPVAGQQHRIVGAVKTV